MKCFTRRIPSVSAGRHIVSCVHSITRCVPAESKGVSTAVVLREFLFSSTVRCTPVTGLSNNRGEHLCLLGILVRTPGILLLSRPDGSLSVPALAVLRSCLSSFTKVIVTISRSECFLSGVISEVFTFRKGKRLARCRNKCASCARTLTEGNKTMSRKRDATINTRGGGSTRTS